MVVAPPQTPDAPTECRKRTLQEIEIDISAAEPPSKKTLRKGKKKASYKPAKRSDTGPASVPETGSVLQTSKKPQWGIWIGNLPFTATKDAITKFLVDNSIIALGDITRVHVPSVKDLPSDSGSSRQDAKVRNKGFAYVDVSSPETLKAALGLSERLIGGRRVLIKDAKDFEGRPEKDGNATSSGTADAKPPTDRIFVGNLSFDTTKDDLKEHFGRCGDVTDVHMATFEDSGKCKGYAWVTFRETQAAAAAIRGWVKTTIEEGSEESSISEPDGREEEVGTAVSKTRNRAKKQKPKKWWVNRIKGRPLRMEFAEDKTVRYKKRFGKGGATRKQLDVIGEQDQAVMEQADTITSATEPVKEPEDSGRGMASAKRGNSGSVLTPKAKARKPSLDVSRLTGGIVESRGKKTVFA